MKKYLSLILITIFCACSSAANESLSSLPKWYSSPKQNDSVNLYGVGDGYTLEEATKSALKSLASKLMVSISSESSSLMEENNYGINNQSKQKIDEVVEKMTFTNYSISNTSEKGEKIYAEISVSKANFIQERTQKLAELNKKMQDIYKNSGNKTILEKRNNLANIIDLSLEAKSINYILGSLGTTGLDKKKNMEQYNFYQQSFDNILEKIEFYIELNDSPKSVGNVISAALSKEKMKIAKSKNIDNLNLVIINIKSDLVTNNIYGTNIAKLKINLELLSSKNKVLANNLIEVTGNSVTSKEEAVNASSASLADQINQEGILKILAIQ